MAALSQPLLIGMGRAQCRPQMLKHCLSWNLERRAQALQEHQLCSSPGLLAQAYKSGQRLLLISVSA